jgi:cobalt-precorrin-5B (C1)-methyltransferase
LERSVKCSNFIGDTIDMAKEQGFRCVLLTGHIGKLIKVSGGMMNTHSRQGDCRMELLAAAAVQENVPMEVVQQMLQCVTTEDALVLLQTTAKGEEMLHQVMERVMDKIMFHLRWRATEEMEIQCMIYANTFGELAKSKGAEQWLTLLVQEQEPWI